MNAWGIQGCILGGCMGHPGMYVKWMYWTSNDVLGGCMGYPGKYIR